MGRAERVLPLMSYSEGACRAHADGLQAGPAAGSVRPPWPSPGVAKQCPQLPQAAAPVARRCIRVWQQHRPAAPSRHAAPPRAPSEPPPAHSRQVSERYAPEISLKWRSAAARMCSGCRSGWCCLHNLRHCSLICKGGDSGRERCSQGGVGCMVVVGGVG